LRSHLSLSVNSAPNSPGSIYSESESGGSPVPDADSQNETCFGPGDRNEHYDVEGQYDGNQSRRVTSCGMVLPSDQTAGNIIGNETKNEGDVVTQIPSNQSFEVVSEMPSTTPISNQSFEVMPNDYRATSRGSV